MEALPVSTGKCPANLVLLLKVLSVSSSFIIGSSLPKRGSAHDILEFSTGHKQHQDVAVRDVASPVMSVTKTLFNTTQVGITDPQVHDTVMGIATNYDM